MAPTALSILLVILLGLSLQIEIFGETPPHEKSELKIYTFRAEQKQRSMPRRQLYSLEKGSQNYHYRLCVCESADEAVGGEMVFRFPLRQGNCCTSCTRQTATPFNWEMQIRHVQYGTPRRLLLFLFCHMPRDWTCTVYVRIVQLLQDY